MRESHQLIHVNRTINQNPHQINQISYSPIPPSSSSSYIYTTKQPIKLIFIAWSASSHRRGHPSILICIYVYLNIYIVHTANSLTSCPLSPDEVIRDAHLVVRRVARVVHLARRCKKRCFRIPRAGGYDGVSYTNSLNTFV